MIFLDTGFLLGLVSERDENHERVKVVIERYRGRSLWSEVVTTNHVISETITVVRAKAHHSADRSHALAVDVGRRLYAGALGRIYQVSAEEERAAFDYFARYRDKEYSFVDCVSFTVMVKLGILEALAVDEDFTHRFVAHPGPHKRK